MDFYTLDENDCPRLTDMAEYYEWKQSLPVETQTAIGFTLAKTESNGVLVSTVLALIMRLSVGIRCCGKLWCFVPENMTTNASGQQVENVHWLFIKSFVKDT